MTSHFSEEYVTLESRTNLPSDEDGKVYKESTRNCARCGGAHDDLDAHAFYIPILDHYDNKDSMEWNWWAKCPVTGDPILIAIKPE